MSRLKKSRSGTRRLARAGRFARSGSPTPRHSRSTAAPSRLSKGRAFAGEGLLDPLKPKERRLISYALDLGVQVDVKTDPVPVKVSRVQLTRGLVVSKTEDRQKRTYVVRNDDTERRIVVLEHPARAGWTTESALKPVETTAAAARFRLTVEPRTTCHARRRGRPRRRNAIRDQLDHGRSTGFSREGFADPDIRRESAAPGAGSEGGDCPPREPHLGPHARHRTNRARSRPRAREHEVVEGQQTEERQLLQRYVKQLDDQETQLATMRKDVESLSADRDRAQAALARLIESISTLS